MRAVVYGAIDALRSVDPWYVAAALALYVLGVSAAGLRWRLILAALGHRVPVADALLTYLAGVFVNNVTPASRLGGEACRIAAIGLRSRVPVPAATVSAVYDRLSEVPRPHTSPTASSFTRGRGGRAGGSGSRRVRWTTAPRHWR
jgi:uncharacterized protein (TIRG00374 family)